jgi:hypothetical protein
MRPGSGKVCKTRKDEEKVKLRMDFWGKMGSRRGIGKQVQNSDSEVKKTIWERKLCFGNQRVSFN